jgi:hypothetical protein
LFLRHLLVMVSIRVAILSCGLNHISDSFVVPNAQSSLSVIDEHNAVHNEGQKDDHNRHREDDNAYVHPFTLQDYIRRSSRSVFHFRT